MKYKNLDEIAFVLKMIILIKYLKIKTNKND